MRIIFLLAFSVSMIFSPLTHAGVMLQGFYWDAESTPDKPWWDKLSAQSNELAKAGFTSLWIPPVLKSASGGLSRGYDPYDDYDIGSKDQRGTIPTHWGTRDQLQRLVAMSRANGMQVVLDLNVSHRAGDAGDKKYSYKDAYGSDGKGRFPKGPDDFSRDFPYGRVFNFNSNYVMDGLRDSCDWLVKALGTQGFRIDSAKEIPFDFLKDLLSHGELQKQYVVVENWDGTDVLYNYVKNGLNSRAGAFDFPLWSTLRDMASGNGLFDMKRLVKPGLLGRAPELSVTFAENDDTDRGFPTIKNKELSYVYILTSEGYPSVYWKDYFVYGMKNHIDRLMWINGALANGATEYRWADDDLLVYERMGSPGVVVGMNDNMLSARTETVQTHFGANVELQDYSGKQPNVKTDGEGKARITVPANGYVAYSVVNVQYTPQIIPYSVTQEFAGANDLDILPAQNGKWNKVGYIYAQAGSPLDWEINFERNNWGQSSRYAMKITGPDNAVLAENSYDGGAGVGKGSVKAPTTGWYLLEAAAKDVSEPVKFWWKQTYQAPQL
jgi:alpha-amylase